MGHWSSTWYYRQQDDLVGLSQNKGQGVCVCVQPNQSSVGSLGTSLTHGGPTLQPKWLQGSAKTPEVLFPCLDRSEPSLIQSGVSMDRTCFGMLELFVRYLWPFLSSIYSVAGHIIGHTLKCCCYEGVCFAYDSVCQVVSTWMPGPKVS